MVEKGITGKAESFARVGMRKEGDVRRLGLIWIFALVLAFVAPLVTSIGPGHPSCRGCGVCPYSACPGISH